MSRCCWYYLFVENGESMAKLRILLQVIAMALPWTLRRRVLNAVFGFEIHPTAHIGKSILLCKKLLMAEHSSIGSGNFAQGLEEIRLDAHSAIGNLNWISAYPLGQTRYFSKFPNRMPKLHLHEHALLINRNLIDCTDSVIFGPFSGIAGNRSQVLTHSIDLGTTNQSCAPVVLGKYCFVGGGSMILKGVDIADYTVVMAGSVVSRSQKESYELLAGVPATSVRKLSPRLKFFTRLKGATD